jgi:hypothetical protein
MKFLKEMEVKSKYVMYKVINKHTKKLVQVITAAELRKWKLNSKKGFDVPIRDYEITLLSFEESFDNSWRY